MKVLSVYNSNERHNLLLGLIAFTMPLPIKYNSWAILLCILNYIISKDLVGRIKYSLKNKYLILLFGLFLAHLTSYFLSENKVEALAIITRRASLLAIPLLISNQILPSISVKKIGLFFISGMMVTFTICIINAFINYGSYKTWDVFFYHKLTEIVHCNAVYMSAYCVLALHIIIYYKAAFHKVSIIIISVSIFIFFILLSSKTMFFILCLGLAITFFKKFNKIRALVYTFIIIGLITIIIASIPKTRERVLYELTSNFEVLHQAEYRYDTHFTGTSLRLLLWKFSWQIISEKKAWLIGVGTGDFHDLLNEKYKKVGIYTGNPELGDTGYLGYGPHNEYVEIFLSLGIIVLCWLLYTLYYYFKLAISTNNYLALQLIILFMLFFVTESVLSTHKGIVPFVFFSMLFIPQKAKTEL